MTTNIIKKSTVTELLRCYERASSDIREGYRLIHEAEVSLNEAYTTKGSSGLYIRDRSNFRGDFQNPEVVLENLKRMEWAKHENC